ncbi:MAG: 2-C-methyl-D-erythritol 2,4-cyclodiphosphate synthase, partial [Ignavibacteriaceae bacterium]|nr:2-C-methyl-D-erythritol 2,4-cyclodiphosphate synthase [Ignavibacteriaceae bacterium]
SKLLLQKAIELIRAKGYEVVNCDSVLVLEKPKIAPYVHLMKKTISGIIGCGEDDISIKATTSEKLGFIGREEGAVAYAVVLLQTLETRET